MYNNVMKSTEMNDNTIMLFFMIQVGRNFVKKNCDALYYFDCDAKTCIAS